MLLWLFGDGPNVHVVLHAGFIIFPFLFALGMYSLALRFASTSAAAVVAITSPAAIVISHMLISDYPTLAFSTLAIALYVNGVDQNKPLRVWIGGGFAALAAFSSYLALMTSIVCWLYATDEKKPDECCMVVAARRANVDGRVARAFPSWHFHRFILGRTAQYWSTQAASHADRLVHKLLAFPIFMAGTLVLPLPLIWLALRCSKMLPAIIWAPISVGLVQVYAGDYALKDRVLMTVPFDRWRMDTFRFVPSRASYRLSGFDIHRCLGGIGNRPDIVRLLFGHGAYLLPLLPPMVLLTFLNRPSRCPVARRRCGVLPSEYFWESLFP
jgi:hypothetical protein